MGLLEQLGCEVRCVADAEAALQALERDTATGYSEAAQGVEAEFPILRKPWAS
jgi:CheY-like chemotaxis protein